MLPMILFAWVALGAASVAVLHHRGHDTFAWAIPFVFLGPLAIPIAVSADRHRPDEPSGPFAAGGLDVLAYGDGSADTGAALDAALGVLGDRVTSLTLAAVVDFEAASTIRGRETRQQAQDRLDAAAQGLTARATFPVATVVLFGEPKHALQHYASANGYELIVTGSHAPGRKWLGSGASTRVAGAERSVPVLVGPHQA